MIIVRAFTSLKRKRRLEFEGCLRLRFRLVGPVKKSKPAVWVSEAQPTGAGLCPRALGLRGIGLTPEVGGCARLDHGLAPVVTRGSVSNLGPHRERARAEAMRWQPEHIADQFERLLMSLGRDRDNNAVT